MFDDPASIAASLSVSLLVPVALAPISLPNPSRVTGRRTLGLTFRAVGLCLFGAFSLCTFALARFLVALIATDTSFAAVVDASRRDSSVWLRAAGLWGSARASIWLWTWLCLAVICIHMFVERRRKDLVPLMNRVRAMAAVTAGFGLLGLVFADPFKTLDLPPTDGLGLSPILEHPAMVVHPPIMYTGLVVTMLAWAYVISPDSTVESTGADAADADSARLKRLLLVAALLTGTALLLGAVWAYDEQGWGGYWAWDPVENGGLLPWLAIVTALHSRLRRRFATTMHVSLVFILTCLGALATRSGVLPSVHGFAEQRSLGWGLLAVVGFVCARTGFALRNEARPTLRGPFRISAVAVARWIGVTAVIVITAGTYAPLLRYLVNGERAQTLGVYFAQFGFPFAVVSMVGLLFDVASKSDFAQTVAAAVLFGTVGVLTLQSTRVGAFSTSSTLLVAAGAAVVGVLLVRSVVRVVARTRSDTRSLATTVSRAPVTIAHLGFALLLCGIGGSVSSVHRRLQLPYNAVGRVGPLTVRNDGVTVKELPGERRIDARLIVNESDQSIRAITPSLRGFERRPVLLAETAIVRSWNRDLYVALQSATDARAVVVDVYVRPLMSFVWAGVVLLLLGLALSLPRQQLFHRRST